METKNKLKFLNLDEENNIYKKISLKCKTEETKLWFLKFKDYTFKMEPTGINYKPEQLIPFGRPFEVPFYRDMPKDGEGLRSGVLEEKILTHFFRSNPKINESPDLILLPNYLHLDFISGSPSGGGRYVKDTVVAYKLRNK